MTTKFHSEVTNARRSMRYDALRAVAFGCAYGWQTTIDQRVKQIALRPSLPLNLAEAPS